MGDDVVHLVHLANLQSALRALFAEMELAMDLGEVRCTFDGVMSVEYVVNGQVVAGEGI